MEKPIGVFDSGVGGLTVAHEIAKQLPNESVIYFGDTGRNPYGTRPMQQVCDFSAQITRFLLTHDAKAIVIACNTATIASLETLQSKFKVPVIGVVDASVSFASQVTKNNKIGLLATEGTVNSGAFQKMLKNVNSEFEITGAGCPKLVQLAEKCIFDGTEVDSALNDYLVNIKKNGCDTVILGCTHFPLFVKPIQRHLGAGVQLVNPADNVVKTLVEIMTEKSIASKSKSQEHKFYTSSKDNKNFIQICEVLFNQKCNVEFVEIEKY